MWLILNLCLLYFCWSIRSILLSLLIQDHRDTWCFVDLKSLLLMVLPGCEMLVLSVHQFSWFLCACSSTGGTSKDV